MFRTILTALVIAGVLAAPAGAQIPLEQDYPAPQPGTYELPPIQKAADGRVLEADGKARKLLDIARGRVTVLSFIYTRCADPRACPFASGVLYRVHEASKGDPVLAENLRLLTFSFDPEHDTPQVMAKYGDGFRAKDEGADWRFLTTASAKDLEPILAAYGQRVDRKKNAEDPLGPLSHISRVYLIDRNQKIRNIYSFGLLDPRLLLADVRTLLLEEGIQAAAR
jgi:cytochrome oxidase Cu insertion factor (SCO1/SenC/PrrC family)